ncbi:response regulator transcription factor [Microbacterium horticulturae]|uniref:Response regulator transcription factor n=1 Tax=Microbacterium horticulturae TaxID=3028316 RepID=A0ABY8BWK4_9MICO|nr:response regulator transcription factor [Microbacterium sp. KACC 23027]WEG08247.1 response regulator transcription factor [Microbacterium sp. KACC 23027]
MSRILIAEDEQRIASFIAKGLAAEGFGTETVADGAQAVEYARSGQYDLLVLDIGLPKLDGFSALRRLRTERVEIPVIILTARDALEDTVAGLSGGADDYMTKPFAIEELVARIRLRLRTDAATQATVLKAGDLTLDVRTRRATRRDAAVELTSREFTLLETFLRHPGEVLSRQQLLSQVWGFDFDPGSNVVDVYVGYLRAKLGEQQIETVRGAGYRLRPGRI